MKIAFGSCYGIFTYRSDIFETLAKSEERPDVFLWLGDAAYVDKSHIYPHLEGMPKSYVTERFEDTNKAKGYKEMK